MPVNNQDNNLRLGSRGSALALVQANRVKALISQVYPELSIEIIIIKTAGDLNQGDIASLGGKSVFVKDIEMALINDEIDIAVHSFKDITSQPVEGLSYGAFLLEERPTDAVILFDQQKSLSEPLTLATGSLRRQQLCSHLYPGIECVPIRGNIDTRIQLAKQNNYDGLILSTAGLQRLQLEHLISLEPDPCQFIPAPGQGMLAIQHRSNDHVSEEIVAAIGNPSDHQLGQLYYTFLQGIAFNCNLPLGAYILENQIHIFVQQDQPKYLQFQSSEIQQAIAAVKTLADA